MNTTRLFLRILVSPFVLALIMVTYIYQAFKRWFSFLKYGGEWSNYDKDINGKTILETYILIKENLKSNE